MRFLWAAPLAFVVMAGMDVARADALPPDQEKACATLKQQQATRWKISAAVVKKYGWYCDFTATELATERDVFYVVALRAFRPDCGINDICSGLMGWFGVGKRTGEVAHFDINEETIIPLGEAE